MRFMMFIYPKLQAKSGGGADNWMPPAEAVAAMGQVQRQALRRRGVLLKPRPATHST